MDLFDLRLWSGFEAAGGQMAEPAHIDELVIDSRLVASDASLFLALPGRFTDGHHFTARAAELGAKYLVVKRGFEPKGVGKATCLFVDDPLKALQEIAAAYRKSCSAKVVAISGSLGKTLVKDLLHQMLAKRWRVVSSPESFNSQIGVPLSLLRIDHRDEIALIEAAITEPGEMERLSAMIQPTDLVLTTVTERHRDTLGSFEKIVAELLLLAPSNTRGTIFAQKTLRSYLEGSPHRLIFWNEDSQTLPHARFLSERSDQRLKFEVTFPKSAPFIGQVEGHFTYFINLINIASKAAHLFGVSRDGIVEALENYSIELMQTEIWRAPMGATFINHPYGSDAQSVDAALRQLAHAPPHHRKIFAFEGLRRDQSGQMRRIGHLITQSKADQLILFGDENFTALEEVISREKPSLKLLRFSTHDEVLGHLRSSLRADDTLLFKGKQKRSLETLAEAFLQGVSHNQCLIDLDAIWYNVRSLRRHLPEATRLMVMVKAQGYGTDDLQLATHLERCGVDILGLSYVDEAVSLKRAGVAQDLFVLNAAPYEVEKVVRLGLEVGASDLSFIELLEAEADRQRKRIRVHLHIDTGMGRFGCPKVEALKLATRIERSPSLILEGVMTHFVAAEDPEMDEVTEKQLKSFFAEVEKMEKRGIKPAFVHVHNSGGAVRFPLGRANMVRIGLALFGMGGSEAVRQKLPLRPAATLQSRIVGINELKIGESVGYGAKMRVEKERALIATLPIGYYDGLHRHYSERGSVLIRGQRAPMVGRICMDYLMCDVTGIEGVEIGDRALFFGKDSHGHLVHPEDFVGSSDSIAHELITCLSPRIQRIFIQEGHH